MTEKILLNNYGGMEDEVRPCSSCQQEKHIAVMFEQPVGYLCKECMDREREKCLRQYRT